MTRAIIKKNGRERVEVSISEFKGRKFLDVRNYYYDSDSDEWKPTQKGVNVPVEMAHELFRAVKKIGKPFFDLQVPPDDEAEGKAGKAGKAAAKKKENESGIQRKPKVDKKEVERIRKAVKKSADEHEASKKKKKSKVEKSDASGTKKKVSKKAKEIGKKVAKEYLEEIDAKISGKKKKKKDKEKTKTKEVKVKKSKRMQLDEE